MTSVIRYFTEDGTWVRPPGAIRVDYLLCGGGGGGAVAAEGIGPSGEDGALQSGSFDPSRFERLEVAIGRGGRGAELGGVKAGDGAAGYALFITHVRAAAEKD